MEARKTKATIIKKCANCGKDYVLDPDKPLKDQKVCENCK